MTPAEVIHTIRTVLDDGLFWYLGFNEINRCVNQAQMQLIDKYHRMDDERALRPLYVYDVAVDYDGALSQELLYPRAARLNYKKDNANTSWELEYLSYNVFSNFASPGIIYGKSMPRSTYWTYYKTMSITNVFETRVRFTIPTDVQVGTETRPIQTCNVLYIKVPPLFNYQATGLNSVNLSVPNEYHLEVALLAAELANNIDVGERDRGDTAIEQMGQKLTLEKAGLI